MITVDVRKYRELCFTAAVRAGIRKDIAESVIDCMMLTDMFGIFTHGTTNLGKYVNKMKAGGIVNADPEVIEEGPFFARLDGKNSFGMYNGRVATDLAIKKAGESGLGFVTVNNSGHFGACSNYTVYGAKKGYLTFAMSNSVKLMTAPGGKGNTIGNSPISYAVPREGKHPVFMDIALSEVAKLKVVNYQKQGKPVPDGWVVDKNGVPTNNPVGNDYSLCPMSAHKGYCMAFLVEILTTVLSGGTFSVKSWLNADPAVPSGISHTIVAIDIGKMMDQTLFGERLEEYIMEITGSPKADGSDKIFYPGEPNWLLFEKAEKDGLVLNDSVEESVGKFLSENSLDIVDAKKE